MPPLQQFVELNQHRIHYVEWPGSGTTVICIPGITSNCRSFDVIAESLAPHHRVIAVDLIGRGGSDKPDAGYGLLRHVSDMLALIGHLGLQSAAVIGHSMGGYVGMTMAAQAPLAVSKLVMVDAGTIARPEIMAFIKPALDRLGKTYASREIFLEAMRAVPIWGADWDDYVERYYDADLQTNDDGTVVSRVSPGGVRQDSESIPGLHLHEMLSHIECPTLILRAATGLLGGETGLILRADDARTMLASLRHGQLVEIAGANHYTIVFRKHLPERDAALAGFLHD